MVELFRENVAIIVSNSEGKVLLCARADNTGMEWQFPQGGIDKGESVLKAAYRELREETGITDVDFIKEMPDGIKYYFPDAIKIKFGKNGGQNAGQNQHYVLFRLKNDNVQIDFETNPQEIEFKAYRWAEIDEAPREIVSFKKEAYQKAAAYFKPYLEDIKKGKGCDGRQRNL